MDYPKGVPGVGLVGGKFVDEDATTGRQGSLIPSAWGNSVTEEILNVIRAAKLVPNEKQTDQLKTAILALMPATSGASETAEGLVQLATKVEAQAGTDAKKALTPAALAACTATESRAGLVMQATAAKVIAGTDPLSVVTPAGLSARTATDARTGLVELATNAEVVAGADTVRAATPAGVKAAIAGAAPGSASETAKGLVQLATKVEVQAGTNAEKAATPLGVGAAIEKFDSENLGFTIIYPNGGTAASPGTISANSRYVMANPFPGYQVMCEVEIRVAGTGWFKPGWTSNTVNAFGVSAGMGAGVADAPYLVVQTGKDGVATNSNVTGSTVDVGSQASAQCRLKVWKAKGKS